MTWLAWADQVNDRIRTFFSKFAAQDVKNADFEARLKSLEGAGAKLDSATATLKQNDDQTESGISQVKGNTP